MKKLSLALFLLMPFVASFASPIDESTAKALAFNFLSSRIVANKLGDATMTLAYKGTDASDPSHPVTCFYVFGFTSAKGFVIISADDVVEPVLGYSTESKFDATIKHGIPIQLTEWMARSSKKIASAIKRNTVASVAVRNSWALLKTPPSKKSIGLFGNTVVVNQLVQTMWDQNPDFITTGPYNALCPYDSVLGGRAVTGCVATAMAQVMKYWNYPAKGIGSNSYTPPTTYLGVQTANFGNTTYQWNEMPDSLSANDPAVEINAIATLMYHCGVSVNMQYGVEGSGAVAINNGGGFWETGYHNAQEALVNNFGYDISLQGLNRSDYQDPNWIGMIKKELNAKRPVIYTGDGTAGGHCFIADGYDNNDFFHFNWGWGGYCDGYFNVDNLDPGGDVFDSDQQILIGIQPRTNYIKSANTTDSLALVALYNGTGGASWTNKSGWLKTPVSSWYGVELDSTGRVNSIQLSNNNLTGNIPTSLGTISNLEDLELNGNHLSGNLPVSLASLSGLTYLDVSGNYFTFAGLEPFAENLSNNGNLTVDYSPQANIPLYQTGTKLWVSVGGNSYDISYQWSVNGSYLTTVYGDSTFTPTIPGIYSVIATDQLLNLSLSSNSDTSAFYLKPNTNDSLALVALYNSTGGAKWKNNGGWLKKPVGLWSGVVMNSSGRVTIINLNDNNLVGSLPGSLNNLSYLNRLDLGINKLTGSMPLSLSRLNSLTYLDMSNNEYNFSAIESITKQFSTGNSLMFYYAPQANIPLRRTGNKLSVSMGGTQSNVFYYWFLNGNYITTTKGDSTFSATSNGVYSVTGYDTSFTNFYLYSDTLNVQGIYIKANATDSLALVSLYNSTGGNKWTDNSGWLKGPVNTWNGIYLDTTGRVVSITLSNNNLSGNLPQSLGNLKNLASCELGNNQLTGIVPASLALLGKLTFLDLSYNDYVFTGLEPLANLFSGNDSISFYDYGQANVPIHQTGKQLWVSVGGTPSAVSYTWYLNGSYVSSNYGDSTFVISAPGQYYVTAYDNIANAHLYSNTDTVYIKANTNDSLALVDLYNNTGGTNWANNSGWLQAPVSVWNGITLDSSGRVTSINLDYNNLTGSLPGSLGTLSNLNQLMLTSNHLSGNVPLSLASLANLSYVDVSYNFYTFGGLEPIYNYFTSYGSTGLYYSPQDTMIPIHQTGNTLSVSVGGTPSDISYTWYMNGSYVASNYGDSTYTPTVAGVYSVNMYDSKLNLYLYSVNDTVVIYVKPNAGDSLALVDLYKNTGGVNWYYNNGWLQGPVSSWYGVSLDNTGRVSSLQLDDNGLVGTLSSSLGTMINLNYLDLGNNQLSGALPTSISNLINLSTLYLESNQLSGHIPSLSNLSSYATIYLNNNDFTFNGMEQIAEYFNYPYYSQQASVPIRFDGSAVSVSVGGTPANNSYNWFENGNLVATTYGDSAYRISSDGQYYVVVNNAVASQLTLYSDTINITTLPIRTISLQAKETNGQVLLQWQTIDELNTASFTIQRSTDGVSFTDIGTESAVGKGNNSYHLTDKYPVNGINYYRIKAIDKDGSISYSPATQLSIINSQLSIFPNPERDRVTIQGNHIAEVRVVNNWGNLITTVSLKDAVNPTVAVNDFAAGVYYLHIKTTGGEESVVKMIRE